MPPILRRKGEAYGFVGKDGAHLIKEGIVNKFGHRRRRGRGKGRGG